MYLLITMEGDRIITDTTEIKMSDMGKFYGEILPNCSNAGN